jgi:phosphoserine phosphatase RsbU/P
VADVCDHGVQSALLMTTARAMIRQRSAMPGDLSMLVGDVNRMLTRDVEDSGQFMTLLVCDLDVAHRRLTWVNAGHDPILIYNTTSRSFEELAGRHVAMGIFENQTFRTSQCQLPSPSVVVLTTDGVWEAHNRQGEPFGRERLKAVIRAQAHQSAAKIVNAIIETVDAHRHPLPMEDDITLVVARL